MSSVLIATDQINPYPNLHYPMRVALPPGHGPYQSVGKTSMRTKSKKKTHKKKKGRK